MITQERYAEIKNYFANSPEPVVREVWRQLVDRSVRARSTFWLGPTGTPRKYTKNARMIQEAERETLSQILSTNEVGWTNHLIKMAAHYEAAPHKQ